MPGHYPSKKQKKPKTEFLSSFEKSFARGGRTSKMRTEDSEDTGSESNSESDGEPGKKLATIERATQRLTEQNQAVDLSKSLHPTFAAQMPQPQLGSMPPAQPGLPPMAAASSGMPMMRPGAPPPMQGMPMPPPQMQGGMPQQGLPPPQMPMPPPQGMPMPGGMPPGMQMQGGVPPQRPQLGALMQMQQMQGANPWQQFRQPSAPSQVSPALMALAQQRPMGQQSQPSQQVQQGQQAQQAPNQGLPQIEVGQIQAAAERRRQQQQQGMQSAPPPMASIPRYAGGEEVMLPDEVAEEPGAALRASPLPRPLATKPVMPQRVAPAVMPPAAVAAPAAEPVATKKMSKEALQDTILQKLSTSLTQAQDPMAREVLTKEIERLESARDQKEGDSIFNSRSALLKLASKLAAPTRTGNFSESISGAFGTLGESQEALDNQRKNSAGELLKLKLQAAQMKSPDMEGLKTTAGILKDMQGKQSQHALLAQEIYPDDPQAQQDYLQKVADSQLAKGQGPALGAFDKKTGNYVASNGTVIKAAEIKEDRKERDEMTKLQTSLGKLTPDVVKKAEGWDWTNTDTSKFIAGKLWSKQLAAQTTVNAASLQERLKNLPPGPASDKDIAQARSSFPGFSDAKALQSWIDLTNSAVNGYMKRQDMKYGDVQWYGVGEKPGKPTDEAKPADKGATPPAQAKDTIPLGTISGNLKFTGGNHHDKANWQPIEPVKK